MYQNSILSEPKESGLILPKIRSLLLLHAAKRNAFPSSRYATIGLIEDVVSAVEPHQKENRMKNTFMILWAPGPAWVPGKTGREQPYWVHEVGMVLPIGLFAHGLARYPSRAWRPKNHEGVFHSVFFLVRFHC